MAEYGNGFVLSFAYCKHCSFYITNWRHKVFPLQDDARKEAEELHETINASMVKHKQQSETCKNRELVISYNRALVEKVK